MPPGRRASGWRCSTGWCATTTRADPLAVTADPAPLLHWASVIFAGAGALVCAAPAVLVLASFVGLVPFDMGMLFVALPALAAAVALALLARRSFGDLTLPRPVLAANNEGIMDRRIMIEPLPWSDVSRAVSIVPGGGGVVLELKRDVSMLHMGSLQFEHPEPGVAHIALRGLTLPAATLARSLLKLAEEANIEVGESRTHDKVPRRSWSV